MVVPRRAQTPLTLKGGAHLVSANHPTRTPFVLSLIMFNVSLSLFKHALDHISVSTGEQKAPAGKRTWIKALMRHSSLPQRTRCGLPWEPL